MVMFVFIFVLFTLSNSYELSANDAEEVISGSFLEEAIKDSQLPKECGRNSVNRIVGGTEAKPHTWPWMAALYERSYWAETDDDVVFICGASIISRRYVVSAAHCIDQFGTISKPESLKLLLGAHNRQSSGQWYKVDKVIRHEKYNDTTMQNDISLLRLKEPIDFAKHNKTIAAVCLANSTVKTEIREDSVVTGWGTLSQMGDISDVLMQVSVPIVQKSVCVKAYDTESITDKNLCAGLKKGGKDSCQGDSGGPLVVKRKNNWFLVGITSWGRGCAQEEAYGVYTKVSSHYDWILNKLHTELPLVPTMSPKPYTTAKVTKTTKKINLMI